MIQKLKRTPTMKSSPAEDVYEGLVEIVKTALSVDVKWLARITATPDTIFELLLESIRNERCLKTRNRYQEDKVEERLKFYLQTYKIMGQKERDKLSDSITCNKLFLVP